MITNYTRIIEGEIPFAGIHEKMQGEINRFMRILNVSHLDQLELNERMRQIIDSILKYGFIPNSNEVFTDAFYYLWQEGKLPEYDCLFKKEEELNPRCEVPGVLLIAEHLHTLVISRLDEDNTFIAFMWKTNGFREMIASSE